MLNGLDLFSGIGGNALALRPWVWTRAYCERERYAQAVLLSRMATAEIDDAPIWDDVTTLRPEHFDIPIDLIVAGFPCQDISVAGRGRGLDGERSTLVFEVFRLIRGLQPAFVFLENVPAIRTRGCERVVKELAAIGYDTRWDCLSAFDVGAPHKRDRWFLLGARKGPLHTHGHGHGHGRERVKESDCQKQTGAGAQRDNAHGFCDALPNGNGNGNVLRHKQRWCERAAGESTAEPRNHGALQSVADSDNAGLERRDGGELRQHAGQQFAWPSRSEGDRGDWWAVEPPVGRVAHGISNRVDRLRGLGNAVVPAQAREAFGRLIGFW